MSFSDMSSFFYWKEIIPLSIRNEAILLTSEADNLFTFPHHQLRRHSCQLQGNYPVLG